MNPFLFQAGQGIALACFLIIRNIMATINEKQIQEWKREHGLDEVLVMRVPGENGKVSTAYFIPPGEYRKKRFILYSRCMTFVQRDQKLEAGQYLFNECFLGGDEIFRDENSLEALGAYNDLVDSLSFLEVRLDKA